MTGRARRYGLAVGLSVAAGGLGAYRVAVAEPIPTGDAKPIFAQTTWTTAGNGPVVPAAAKADPPLPMPPTIPTLPTVSPAAPGVVQLPTVSQLPTQPVAGTAPLIPPAPPIIPPLPTPTAPPEAAPTPRTGPPKFDLPGLPAPAVPVPTSQPPEVAPSARPAQSREVSPPARPVGSDFRLRPTDPGLTLKPGGPAAGQAAAPAPGDVPMLTANKLLLSATLGAALAGTPTPAQDPKSNPAAPGTGAEAVKKDDLADLKATLNGLKDDVARLKTVTKDADEAVFGKKDGKGAGADIGLLARFAKMEDDLKRFEETLKRIEGRLNEMAKTTTSGFGPTAPAKSFVRIVNDYQTDMTLILNRASHRLSPGEWKTVEVPPGSYTYELLVPGGQPVTSTLKDGETVTLRIK